MKIYKLSLIILVLLSMVLLSCEKMTVEMSCEEYQRYGYPSDAVGKAGQGGIVFYDKGHYSDGWRYLEAAPASTEFNAQWGAYGTNVTGTSTDIGTGKANTDIIVTRLAQLGETGRAAQLCVALNVNGYNDWFLPSRDELNAMYRNLHVLGLGSFGQGTNSASWMNWCYWSSSHYSSYTFDAWYQDFDNGLQTYYYFKPYTNRVRAIRAF